MSLSRSALVIAAVTILAQPGFAARLLPMTRCPGDCDRDGRIAISELVTGVTIFLGDQPLESCGALDLDGNLAVSVDELIASSGGAQHGCPPAMCGDGIAEATEQCDGSDTNPADVVFASQLVGAGVWISCNQGCGFCARSSGCRYVPCCDRVSCMVCGPNDPGTCMPPEATRELAANCRNDPAQCELLPLLCHDF